jgi:hypothetical protein
MSAPQTPPELPTQPAELHAPPSLTKPGRMGGLLRQVAVALGWQHPPGAKSIDPLAARAAFVACLADLPALDSLALCRLLSHAGSLSELWHLRPEVYRLLALHHSQAEAERRLALIGQQFDRRSGSRRLDAPAPVPTSRTGRG